METSKKFEFLVKLEELLSEYDATISFDADPSSDWYGITGEKILVSCCGVSVLAIDGFQLDSESEELKTKVFK